MKFNTVLVGCPHEYPQKWCDQAVILITSFPHALKPPNPQKIRGRKVGCCSML